MSGIGIVRVPSGMRTRTRRPSRGSAPAPRAPARATSGGKEAKLTTPLPTTLTQQSYAAIRAGPSSAMPCAVATPGPLIG